MGFHIAMTLCAMLLPITMIAVGAWYFFHTPTELNHWSGYRTPMSMKSPQTWFFAQKMIGRLWFPAGMLMTPLTLNLMLLLPDGTEASVESAVMLVITLQTVILLGTIVIVEILLYKHFDKNGNPRL